MKFQSNLCLLLLALLLANDFAYAQPQSKRLDQFEATCNRLKANNQPDSMMVAINRFSQNKDLDAVEKQKFYLWKNLYYKMIGRYQEAVDCCLKALNCQVPPVVADQTEKLLYFNLADSYFTMLRYTDAYHYALKAKPLLGEHERAIDNASILGYCYYLKGRYAESLKEYEFANALNRKYHISCKEAEVLYKIAKVNDKLGHFGQAVAIVDRAIKVSDSCGLTVNSINGRLSKYDILRGNHQYEAATLLMDSIRKMENDFAFNDRNQKMDALEAQYKDKLKTQENASLLLINAKNSKVISQQKTILWVSILTLLLFLMLVFYLFKFSRKQRATNLELENQKNLIELNNKELQRLNILNQKIFSVISHDFKGPITTLKLLLSNKKIEESENPEIAAYIKDIALQLEQSDIMLENLLDWAKNELQVKAFTNESIYPRQLVDEVLYPLVKNAREKKLHFNNTIPPYIVITFPNEILRIVLRNIISNAIKFSDPETEISISFDENSIRIKDSGKGIPAAKLSKLFNQSVNPGLGTFQESGFGLGLYLSYELIQKHNGSIKAENNSDKGATFSIILPG